jgi:hypothetical protein
MLRSPTTPNRTRVQTRSDMKHEATRNHTPTLSASAAGGIARPHRQKHSPNAFGVRLFKV